MLNRRTLNAAQAQTLLDSTTVLIQHLRTAHQSPISGCVNRAVEVLGTRYIFLEALFCVIQTIEPSINASQWWPKLIEGISTTYIPFRHRNFSHRSLVLDEIAERLSAALNSLKDGVWPDILKTLWLKRALFGSAAVYKFKNERWDL